MNKIKKMKFANASKQGDIITILMNVWPDKNKAEVNQADFPANVNFRITA